ncbi:MAG: hypothetical protein PF505_14300 [Vallitaleaceae bacterium]|jgi:hypothetical protein|nr:hypothetical protein [Vallitaleaceae bacterium]
MGFKKYFTLMVCALLMISLGGLPSFGAISTEVIDVTTDAVTVHWSSDRNDVDSYTLSIDGNGPVPIAKGEEIIVTGARNSKHTIEIIGTTTIPGKVYELSLETGIPGIYYEMSYLDGQWVKEGQEIAAELMNEPLVKYSELGEGFYRESVIETVIMEKITLEINLLNTVTVVAMSNDDSIGSVDPEIKEVIVGDTVVFTAIPKENYQLEKWLEVTDVGYEIMTIGYTKQITIAPSSDKYIKAIFIPENQGLDDGGTDSNDDLGNGPDDDSGDGPDDGIDDNENIDNPEDIPEGLPNGLPEGSPDGSLSVIPGPGNDDSDDNADDDDINIDDPEGIPEGTPNSTPDGTSALVPGPNDDSDEGSDDINIDDPAGIPQGLPNDSIDDSKSNGFFEISSRAEIVIGFLLILSALIAIGLYSRKIAKDIAREKAEDKAREQAQDVEEQQEENKEQEVQEEKE